MIRCRTLVSSLKAECAQSDKRRNVGIFKWDHNTAFRAPLLGRVQETPYFLHQQQARVRPNAFATTHRPIRAFRVVIAARDLPSNESSIESPPVCRSEWQNCQLMDTGT